MIIPPVLPIDDHPNPAHVRRFIQDNFKPIRNDLISHYFDLFNDPCVKIATPFVLNSTFSGGVHAKRNKKQFTKKASDWFSRTYQAFGRDVLRWCWIASFAACTTVQYEGEMAPVPVCIDLTQVIIRYYLPAIGRPEFRFFEIKQGVLRPDGPHQPLEHEITNVTVFIPDSPPSKLGGLSCIMSVLEQDIVTEQFRIHCLMAAENKRSNPPVVLQRETKSFSVNALQPDISKTGSSAHDAAQQRLNDTVDAANKFDVTKQKLANQELMRKMNSVDENYAQTILREMKEMEPESVTLPSGRVYVSAQLPEAPQNLLEWNSRRMETVSNLFSLPKTMFSSTGSTTSGEGGANKTAKGNENHSHLFESFLKRTRALLSDLCKFMYQLDFQDAHIDELFTEFKKQGMDDDKKIMEKMSPETLKQKAKEYIDDIEIQILAAPDLLEVVGLYEGGYLEYKDMRWMAADALGVSEDVFCKKPALSIKETNGILPKPVGSATGGSKPASKTKKKNSSETASSSTKPKKKKQKTSP